MRKLIYACLVLSYSPAMWAGKTVGVLTSDGPVRLRGIDVPAAGARGLSVVSGDEVQTLKSPARITLSNGDTLELDLESLAGLELREGITHVYIWRGRMKFNLAGTSLARRISICAAGTPVSVLTATTATLTIDQNQLKTQAPPGSIQTVEGQVCGIGRAAPVAIWGWPTIPKLIIVAGGTTAIGVVVYREVTEPSTPPVSESNPQR